MSEGARTASAVIQERDINLCRDLFLSRIMTSAHVASLHFGGSREAAKKRLQKLKAAGLIAERKRGSTEHSVLFLTGKAFYLLRDHGHLQQFPELSRSTMEKRANVSDITLRHELAIMDVKAAFHSTIRNSATFNVAEFCTWPLLHEFKSSLNGYSNEILVKPDGFIRIHEKESDGRRSEHTFFLELDRSTETQDRLISKAACYLSYYTSGGFALRNGSTRDRFKDFPFRILFVMKNAERRNITAERLLQGKVPILSIVCLTTFEEVIANPLGSIWITPAAYRDAASGISSDPSERNGFGYKRQAKRELVVEERIKKTSLLT